MKAIEHLSVLGKNIKCAIKIKVNDSEKWSAEDWMEWQANGIATKILMPSNTTKLKINALYKKYKINENEKENLHKIEIIIDELSQFYGVSKQAAKVRMKELGYNAAEGVYTYVNGKYTPSFAFRADSIGKN